MAVPANTVAGLRLEGLNDVNDLAEFGDDEFKVVAENLRRPAGTMADPNFQAVAGGAQVAPQIPIPPYVIGAKSLKRMKIASKAVMYYITIDRPTTPANMHFTNLLKDFEEQWKSLERKKEADAPDTPTITRALPIMKWSEAFETFLSQVIGNRMIPLSYVIRTDETVAATAPPLIANKCYSVEHGSVEGELVARSSHGHVIFKDDNQKVYNYLEEATRSTQYANSLKKFARTKNGRGAWLALLSQYAGKDKYTSEIEKQEDFIHNRKWRGNNKFSLEAFIMQHRSAHVSLERCALQVPYQLPNERTRVQHLLRAIECSDQSLKAALANVISDENGKMLDFEAAAGYLLKFDPVKKRKANQQHQRGGRQNISQVTTDVDKKGGGNMKPHKGSTGVEFRFYDDSEYYKLSKAQRAELREYRENHPGSHKKSRKSKGGGRGTRRDDAKQFISALKSVMEEEEAEANAKEKASAEKEKDKAWIVSVVNQVMSSKSPATAQLPPVVPSAPLPKPQGVLKSILKRSSK